MAFVKPGHRYDKTVIGGNAAVVQGNVRIATAYFACGHQSGLLRTGRYNSGRRRKVRFVHGADRCECGLIRRRLETVPEEDDSHAMTRDDPATGEAVATEHDGRSSSRPGALVLKHRSCVLGLERNENYTPYQHTHSTFLPIVSRIFSHVIHTLSRLIPGGNLTGPEEIPRSISWTPDESGFNHALMQPQGDQSLQQLLTYGAAMVFGLVFRNVQGKDIYNVLLRFRNDRTLPVWTLPLGFLLARVVFVNKMTRSLSSLSAECIIFEDAFGKRRPISMSICQRFSILEEFLQVHYEDTTGLPLILAGQYNMLLGSRRGRVIHSGDWSAGLVKPGSYVVMAVYLRTDCTICIKCDSDLDVTVTGEFHCQLCDRYFRDCDTLRYVTQIIPPLVEPSEQRKSARPTMASGNPALSSRSLPVAEPIPRNREKALPQENSTQTPPEDPQASTDDVEYDVNGLKNIDLRITPLESDKKLKTTYSEPWYEGETDGNGLYHCLSETEGCGHRPTKHSRIYAKNLDMHLKPYTCKFGAIRKGCRNLRFASEAHLAKHVILVHDGTAISTEIS